MPESILDEDELLRRVHPNNGLVWDDNRKAWTASKAALSDSSGRFSVNARRLFPDGLTPLDLSQEHPVHVLFTFVAMVARNARFEVVHTPEYGQGTFAESHCDVVRREGMGGEEFRSARTAVTDTFVLVLGSLPAGFEAPSEAT